MEHLEKFKDENINQFSVLEINNLTIEELDYLADQKLTFTIEHKKTKIKSHQTFKSFASLKGFGLENHTVIGILKNKSFELQPEPTPEVTEEVLKPKEAIILEDAPEPTVEVTEEVIENDKPKRGRKPNN